MLESVPAAAVPATPAPAQTPAVPAGAPDPGADDLQRLAALAMAQMGESSEPSSVEAAPHPEPVPPESIVEEAKIEDPAPVLAVAPEPAPVSSPQVVSAPSPEPPVAAETEAEPPPTRVPEAAPQAFTAAAPAAAKEEGQAEAPSASVAFNLNTCTAEELVTNIPGCSPELSESIIEFRNKIGSFKRLEDLLEVPGITKAAYTNLTGEAPPENRIPLSLNELLGYPVEMHLSLKDVTDRIACWPDVTGCVLSQSSGLSLVGTVPDGVNKAAIVAFAPRMFESINKSFLEVSGKETDALVIPLAGTSFHLFRNRELYLIIMSRVPQMPERHVKVARFVLAALSIRKD
jgi:competence ComEA-like helix-hairpin-helix protein